MNEEEQKLMDAATRRLVEVATPILQGLLASGHYTRNETDTDPGLRRWNAGEDWRDDHARKHPSHAVGDAIDLAQELLKQAKMDVESEAR